MFDELGELGDQMADGLQRQHHDTARHQAPEAGNDGGERGKAEVAALNAAAAKMAATSASPRWRCWLPVSGR